MVIAAATMEEGSARPWMCLIFDRDVGLEAALERRAEARGHPFLRVAAGYEVHGAGEIRAPMDYLDAAEADSVYDAFYAWQRDLLSRPLSDGRSLAEASALAGGDAPALEGWAIRFGAHLHLRIRFARFLRAALTIERPAVLCPVGRSPSQSWAPTLIAEIARDVDPDIVVAPPTRLLEDEEAWGAALAEQQSSDFRERSLRVARGALLRGLTRDFDAQLRPLLDSTPDDGGALLERIDTLIELRQAIASPVDARIASRQRARIVALEELTARQARRLGRSRRIIRTITWLPRRIWRLCRWLFSSKPSAPQKR